MDSQGRELMKRQWNELQDTIGEMKDAFMKEDEEKSAKIRRLLQDNIEMEKTLLRLQNSPFQRPMNLMTRPNQYELFPAEVWEMIIKHVNRSTDLEYLCLAFPSLEPLVKKSKKTVMLFGKVIPFVSKYLGLKDMTNCLLVCDKWNQDVCQLLADWNAPNLLPKTWNDDDEVISKMPFSDHEAIDELRYAYKFENYRKIQNFLIEMEDHPGNPFVGRILRLSVRYQTELEHFWNWVLRLVLKFGEYVWNLEIKCFRTCHNQRKFYKAVQQTLTYLPNLKYLTIDCMFKENGPSTKTMALEIVSYPLPPLPYLQSLTLDLNCETKIISAFASLFSSQIRRLKLLHGTLRSVHLKDVSLLGFINLKQLEVVLHSSDDLSRVCEFFAPNMEELRLHSHYFFEPLVSISMKILGSLLEKFSRLKHLDLTYCQIERDSSIDSEVQFPRLQILEIAAPNNKNDFQNNLDFLLWFPTLKHFIIDKRYYTHLAIRPNADRMDNHF